MVLCIWNIVYHEKAQEVRTMNKAATFETTYTRYPFAPLVELGLAFAAWLKGSTNKADKSGKANHSGNVTGAVGHAA